MGGYVTQSRSSSTKGQNVWTYVDDNMGYRFSGSPYDSGVEYSPPVQTTTSFRTGSAVVVPEDELLYTDSTSKAAYLAASSRRLGGGSKSTGDTGHDFYTSNVHYTFTSVSLRNVSNTRRYSGPMWATRSALNGSYPTMSFPSMQSLGIEAIRKTSPTHPATSLSTALSELVRDKLPALVGASFLRERSSRVRDAGGEYLNVEFGWKPLVKDIVATMHAVADSEKILQQYRRDSGRIVRRRLSLGEQSQTVSHPPKTGVVPYVDPYYYGTGIASLLGTSTGTLTQSRTQTHKSWFSGAYTYYLNDGTSAADQVVRFEQLANRLLGVRITPEVLWELAPWSWLADWRANVGSNIANASALGSDGLVIRWGYLMRTVTTVDTNTLSGLTASTGESLPPLVTSVTSVTKERVKATPFGFDLTPGSFTNRQWSILAALGMTKSPRSLAF